MPIPAEALGVRRVARFLQISLALGRIALQGLLENLLNLLPISRSHGAEEPFFNNAGQLTITVNGSEPAAISLARKR